MYSCLFTYFHIELLYKQALLLVWYYFTLLLKYLLLPLKQFYRQSNHNRNDDDNMPSLHPLCQKGLRIAQGHVALIFHYVIIVHDSA